MTDFLKLKLAKIGTAATGAARATARAAQEGGVTFTRYFFANIWALMPVAGALLMIAVAHSLNELPADCSGLPGNKPPLDSSLYDKPPPDSSLSDSKPLHDPNVPGNQLALDWSAHGNMPSPDSSLHRSRPTNASAGMLSKVRGNRPRRASANWILCDIRPNPLDEILGYSQRLIQSNGKELSSELSTELTEINKDRESLGALHHDLRDELRTLENNRAPPLANEVPNSAPTSAQAIPQSGAQEIYPPTDPVTELSQRYDGQNNIAERALRRPVANLALAAREAKARLLWVASLGVLQTLALIVSIAALWLTIQSFRQHTSVLYSDGSPLKFLLEFIGLSVVTALVIGLFLLWILSLVYHVARPASTMISDFLTNPRYSAADDQLMNWLLNNEQNVGVQIHFALILLALGLFLIMLLVTSVLYQAPGDDAFRAGTDTSEPRNARYRRYLGRSFARLKLAIYMGAALLGATVAEVSSRYSWPIALVPSEMNDLAQALNEFVQQYTLQIAIGFSVFLGVLYFPAVAVLRQRARDYYRARNPEHSLQEQEDFMANEGLTIKLESTYTQLLALLTPIGVAAIDHAITSLS